MFELYGYFSTSKSFTNLAYTMKIYKCLVLLGFLALLCQCTTQPEPWAFHYPGDSFTDDALLDLRYLNESYAGEHGFIGLSDDGESFVRGDGEEIRFWPVNGGGSTRRMSPEDLAWHARFLAKQGVNMNRWHGSINPSGKGRDIFEVDTAEVDAIWRWVAAMKKEGIYSTISPFWAHNGHLGGWVPEEWGLDGYSGKDELWGVMYFNDRLKQAYKTWVSYLYTEINPYTGIALKDDPAVGLIQIKNEDGIFWWTISMGKPELKFMMSRRFGFWLKEEYGSLGKAIQFWNGEMLPGDDPEKGVMDLYHVWELTQAQEGAKAKRMADQTRFMAIEQYNFYKEIFDFYREKLGCKQLINANNWKTADPTRLNDLERWTYSACDVPAVNRYYAPGHVGENNGWRIDPGHYYQGKSALKNPDKIPVNVKQVAGSPMIITESGWNLPHKYQSEAPALVAAYQSLSGFDAFYWFNVSSKDYMEFPYFEFTKDSAGRYAMNRWTCSTPGGLSQFPAFALIYRMGYLREGETLVHEHRSMEDLWNREVALISEEVSFDPNRDQIEGIVTRASDGGLSPLTFLAGPVKVSYGGDPGNNFVSGKLDELIDPKKGRVKSVTGEIELNYRDGIFTFSAEKAACVSGFVKSGGSFELGDVTVKSKNDYITVGISSLDDAKLSESKRILIQTGTTYRPTGWKEEEASFVLGGDSVLGYRILDTGKMPWLADPTLLSVSVANPGIQKAYMLDPAGYIVKEIRVKRFKERVELQLPPESLYVVLVAE